MTAVPLLDRTRTAWASLRSGSRNDPGPAAAAGGCRAAARRGAAGGPAFAQSADERFLATLGELREASFPDKAAIVERLSAADHPRVRPVLTALLEDRLYFRVADQKIFIVKSGDDSLASFELIDPLSLKDAGSAAARRADQDRARTTA